MLVTPRERKRRRRAFISILIVGAGVTWYSTTSTVAEVKPKDEVVAVEQTDIPILIITPTPEQAEEVVTMPKYNIPLSEELQKYIWDICQEYNIEYELFIALIKQESNFDTQAVNKNSNGTTDRGITQLCSVNKSWHSELAGVDEEDFDAMNPYMNTKASLGHLKSLYDTWKKHGYTGEELDIRVLNSYNMGVSGYKSYIKNNNSIHRTYSKNIIYYRNKLKENGGL